MLVADLMFLKSCCSWCPMLTKVFTTCVFYWKLYSLWYKIWYNQKVESTCHALWGSFWFIRRGLWILCQWIGWLQMLDSIWQLPLCTFLNPTNVPHARDMSNSFVLLLDAVYIKILLLHTSKVVWFLSW